MLKTPDKKVNVQALLDHADFIEGLGDKYRQDKFEICGTPGCICGWLNWRMGRKRTMDLFSIFNAANDLGLDLYEASKLFAGGGGTQIINGKIQKPTPQRAAKCLREIAMTGEVPGWWYGEINGIVGTLQRFNAPTAYGKVDH